MRNGQKIDLGMTGYAELFMTDEERKTQTLPRIVDIPVEMIDDFPDHPFKVRMDRKYNPNTIIDRGMEQREIDQYYPFSEWRKKHKDLSKVLVRDLVMAENINRKAILHFYDSILKAFYKSQEYNCREYRFQDYWDLLQMKKEKKK